MDIITKTCFHCGDLCDHFEYASDIKIPSVMGSFIELIDAQYYACLCSNCGHVTEHKS